MRAVLVSWPCGAYVIELPIHSLKFVVQLKLSRLGKNFDAEVTLQKK